MEKDFYSKSIEFASLAKKLSTYEIKRLNHPFLSELPKHLYKYRKSGKAGRIDFYIGEGKIYTSSLNNFHDKFEGLTPATKQRLLSLNGEGLCRYYRSSIIEILAKRIPSLNIDYAETIFEFIIEKHFDREAVFECSKSLVKETEQNQLKAAIGALSYIFEKMDTDLNSNESFAKGIKMLANTNDEIGAYCMCDTFSNDSLWDLYADNFAGYCIEYDLTDPCRSKGSIRFVSSLFPIEYVERKDDDWFKPLYETVIKAINVNGKTDLPKGAFLFHHWILKTLCSKKNVWSGEKEWRFLGKGNSSHRGPIISSIIVGHNINKCDFLKIHKYAEEKRYSLKITDIDYSNQSVMARDITKLDMDLIMSRE